MLKAMKAGRSRQPMLSPASRSGLGSDRMKKDQATGVYQEGRLDGLPQRDFAHIRAEALSGGKSRYALFQIAEIAAHLGSAPFLACVSDYAA